VPLSRNPRNERARYFGRPRLLFPTGAPAEPSNGRNAPFQVGHIADVTCDDSHIVCWDEI
jgi:hypothetical protein